MIETQLQNLNELHVDESNQIKRIGLKYQNLKLPYIRFNDSLNRSSKIVNNGKFIMVFNLKIICFYCVYITITFTSMKSWLLDVSLIFNHRYSPNQTDNQSDMIFI